jgi:putative glutamine amidotransferase
MRPLVAVTGRHLEPGRVTGWTGAGLAIPRAYTDALTRAGAQPVGLPPTRLDDAIEYMQPFHGLVLTGGADVDPSLYGETPHERTYGVDPELDEFEIALARAAIESAIPVLAICRGAQVLNVALGGSLEQHVPDRLDSLSHSEPGTGAGGGADHDVIVLPDTRLAAALGTDHATVRSQHHQAVDRLAEGAIACAWAPDGLLEAYELEEGWVVAVQWHPETTAGDDPIQQNLFDRFVKESS